MKKYKLMSVVGARPQFIKATILSAQLRKHFNELFVHTGQHYDLDMSGLFFDQLPLPKPDYNLNIHPKTHAEQTGKMLIALEKIMLKEKPVVIVVYGDTNTTLAASLAAAKLNIPVAHVEAGLRSFDKSMPEEINRILSDHLASLLFCPTKTSMLNLEKEGIVNNVFLTGDVMYEMLNMFLPYSKKSKILDKLNLIKKNYLLLTLHRAVNTDIKLRLDSILSALSQSGEKIIFPIHPRTKKAIKKYNIKLGQNIVIVNPVTYIDMLALELNAKKIITDSGGVQKEAFWLGVPCITLRENTEWPETLANGMNILVGASKSDILHSIRKKIPLKGSFFHSSVLNNSSKKITEEIIMFVKNTYKKEKQSWTYI